MESARLCEDGVGNPTILVDWGFAQGFGETGRAVRFEESLHVLWAIGMSARWMSI